MLLQVDNGKVVPSGYALSISAFKVLNTDELAYIYFMLDPKSPYAKYSEDARKEQVLEDVPKVKMSKKLQAGMDKYDELIDSVALQLLRAGREGAFKLRNYFRDVDLQERDDNGKLVHSAKDLMYNLTKLGDTIDGIDKLEEIVKKQEAEGTVARGGVEIGRYNV